MNIAVFAKGKSRNEPPARLHEAQPLDFLIVKYSIIAS
jgi:hypothetical protein